MNKKKGKLVNKYLFNNCCVQNPVFRSSMGRGGAKEREVLRGLLLKWGPADQKGHREIIYKVTQPQS